MIITSARLASAGVLLLAVTLLASAALKLADPYPAAHALVWTGAGSAARMAAVIGVSMIEAAFGAVLAAGVWSKTTLWSSAAFAIALAAGHAAMSVLGDGDACGCFGALAVPDALVYGLLGVGAASCLLRARQHVARRGPWPAPSRAAFAAVLAAAAIHPLWAGESVAAEASPSEVVAELGIADPGADEILMVGSWACEHCRRAIDEIEERRESELRDELVLHLVRRRSDRAAPLGVGRSWIREHRVADRLWWAMIADRPPVFLRRDGTRIRVASEWR